MSGFTLKTAIVIFVHICEPAFNPTYKALYCGHLTSIQLPHSLLHCDPVRIGHASFQRKLGSTPQPGLRGRRPRLPVPASHFSGNPNSRPIDFVTRNTIGMRQTIRIPAYNM